MQSGTFWDTSSRNVTMCALTSSRLDDFSDIVTYVYCNDNNTFLGGGGWKLGIFGEGTFTPQIPWIEPCREMSDLLSKLYQVLWKISYRWALFVVCKQNSLHLPSFGVNILFNCSDLGIHLCTTWQLFNFKTKLGGEICSSHINMQKGHCKWEYIVKKLIPSK